MIKRIIKEKIKAKIGRGKAILILGARQTGKTTLLQSIIKGRENVMWLNGDDSDTVTIFESTSARRLRAAFAGVKTLVVDEAQRIENVGLKFKLITDQIPEIQLIATGSSAFELANKINEPLTGRKYEFHLFPLSFEEMTLHHGFVQENRLLDHRLIYGYYPEVVVNEGEEKETLRNLSDSYLFKDILLWNKIKKSDKIIALLKALSYQVGSEVSYFELAGMVGLDNETVERYIQLLEQVFVIFRLPSFSRNHRRELKRSRKIYFYDNGIRNALITDFRIPEMRNDIGALWENFLISERMKYLQYHSVWANSYFWRTKDQQEIDYIEEMDGKLYAFEFKWGKNTKSKIPQTFKNTYPGSSFQLINRDNYETFIMSD